ncbi:head GIN domain-containing protein [Niabella insulamsoli]|uniref:head GIN domain-containing protein n=1 Tax=Niabella insulamsoli TaxID=3144874 RepID=UPI0031FC7DAC
MKQLSLFAYVAALLTFASGCKKIFPEGPAVKEARVVPGFTAIEAAFSGDVQFVQGAARSVEVEAAQNIQGYILAEVKGHTLVVKTRPNISIKKGSVKVYISNPDLDGAAISGSGNFTAQTVITSTYLNLRISGSGNIKLQKITAASVDADITGSGNIAIEAGNIQEQAITISGNGNYESPQMRSEKANVRLTGSGAAKVWAEDRLDVSISGSGDVWYSGSPDIHTSISGSGRVRKL